MIEKLILVIFLRIKNYMKIFQFITFRIKLQQVQNQLEPIRFYKTDEFIVSLDGKIKHLILLDYGLFNKIFDKSKYLISIISKKVVLQIVLIIIFERSKLIHIILCLLKKYLLFIM